MDGADEMSMAKPETNSSGLMDSERPSPEGSDATQMDDLPSSRVVSESPRTAVEAEKLSNEMDHGIRRGSSGRNRSRHSSEGSDTSKKRSRSRHKSKQDDGTSSSGTRSSTSHRSRTKNHKPKDSVGINSDEKDIDKESTTDDEANAVVHVESFTTENGTKTQSTSSQEVESGKDHKKIAKRSKKLLAEKQKYLTEKQLLKSKMEKAKKEFEEEIRNYEKEVDSKRQEMQTQFSDLRVDEQYSALAQRMDELAGFREELDSRFLQSVEYEKEIEEIERYLDRRQELCNSKEEDLRLLDDQLDMLNQELELDKERLERAGFDVANMQPRKRKVSRIPQKGTETDEDDYILKANLRKCQGDLKKAEASLQKKDLELIEAKEEISVLQADKKKSKEKMKQLETQLSLALSQLKNQQTNSDNSPSKPTLNRHASVRSHVSLDSLKSPSNLSINQQAQLNRSLSSNDKGVGSSPSGKGGMSPAGKKYLSSRKSSTDLFAPAVPRSRSTDLQRRGSSYDGIACQDEILEGSEMRPRSMTEGTVKTQPTTVSSTCVVM